MVGRVITLRNVLPRLWRNQSLPLTHLTVCWLTAGRLLWVQEIMQVRILSHGRNTCKGVECIEFGKYGRKSSEASGAKQGKGLHSRSDARRRKAGKAWRSSNTTYKVKFNCESNVRRLSLQVRFLYAEPKRSAYYCSNWERNPLARTYSQFDGV